MDKSTFKGGKNVKTGQFGLILFVEKYEECVAFYKNILTLKVVYDKKSLTCFRFGSAYLMVEHGGVGSSREKNRSENPTVLRFDVSDLDVTAAELRAKGQKVELESYEWGRIGVFTDPDGNRCELKSVA
jgi:lactoylglutathione lyase